MTSALHRLRGWLFPSRQGIKRLKPEERDEEEAMAGSRPRKKSKEDSIDESDFYVVDAARDGLSGLSVVENEERAEEVADVGAGGASAATSVLSNEYLQFSFLVDEKSRKWVQNNRGAFNFTAKKS